MSTKCGMPELCGSAALPIQVAVAEGTVPYSIMLGAFMAGAVMR